ncbi:MAG: signal peptidase II [Actinomycetales bacterium]
MVDFIAFPNFPVFNVADMCIVGSVILMVLLSLRGVDYRGSLAAR